MLVRVVKSPLAIRFNNYHNNKQVLDHTKTQNN